MRKQDLKSLYSWAESIASSPSSSTSSKRNQNKRPNSDGATPSSLSKRLQTSPSAASDQQVVQERCHANDNVDDDVAWSFPSDTSAALKMLWAQFPSLEKVSVPPFVLRSQLYSVVKDRTLVDRELEVLKQDKVIRILKLSSGQDDYGIVRLNDYLAQVKAAKKRLAAKNTESAVAVFDWFMESVLPGHADVGIIQAHLESLLSQGGIVQENHISLLVKSGLLVRRLADDKAYWFAIPNIGFLLKSLAQGRKELLSLLNRRHYKEMLLSLLEKKRLRTSQLGMRFHVRDLLGSGHLCLTHTTSGLLIRLPKD